VIRARSTAGIFYGVQTLAQLVEGKGADASLPRVRIDDWPSLALRGTMVDMSEGRLATEAEIKRQIDHLARWKANQYYFYNEDSIQLDRYPP
jgi:hexosaminidase